MMIDSETREEYEPTGRQAKGCQWVEGCDGEARWERHDSDDFEYPVCASHAEGVVKPLPAVAFRVAGMPRPQGSTRAFMHGDKPVITSTTKGLGPWRDAIGWEARRAGGRMLTGAVRIEATFLLPRPKSDTLASGRLAASALEYPAKRPDIDKLARALLDALTGVAYRDDSQVVALVVGKRYTSDTPGVSVKVWEMA